MKKEIVVLVFIFFMFSSSIPLKAGVRTLYMLAAIPNDGSFQFNFLYRDRTYYIIDDPVHCPYYDYFGGDTFYPVPVIKSPNGKTPFGFEADIWENSSTNPIFNSSYIHLKLVMYLKNVTFNEPVYLAIYRTKEWGSNWSLEMCLELPREYDGLLTYDFDIKGGLNTINKEFHYYFLVTWILQPTKKSAWDQLIDMARGDVRDINMSGGFWFSALLLEADLPEWFVSNYPPDPYPFDVIRENTGIELRSICETPPKLNRKISYVDKDLEAYWILADATNIDEKFREKTELDEGLQPLWIAMLNRSMGNYYMRLNYEYPKPYINVTLVIGGSIGNPEAKKYEEEAGITWIVRGEQALLIYKNMKWKSKLKEAMNRRHGIAMFHVYERSGELVAMFMGDTRYGTLAIACLQLNQQKNMEETELMKAISLEWRDKLPYTLVIEYNDLNGDGIFQNNEINIVYQETGEG